jgi:bacteriorhodopsin
LRIDWAAAIPIRHFAASSIWVVFALLLFMYIVFVFITSGASSDPNNTTLPINVLIASDHSAYIGILTNITLGMLLTLLMRSSDRRGWIGQVIFWGVNGGLIVFVIGLIVNTAEIKRIGAPVMGVTLLIALAVLAYSALTENLESSEANLDAA